MPVSEEDSPTHLPLAKWINGDEIAFVALHARFTPLLRARIRRHRVWPLLTSRLEVEDVVQEIWARALPAARASFRDVGPGSFLAFLGTIADRGIIDLARRRSARKRDDGAEEALATGFDAPDLPRPGRSALETPTSRARVMELTVIAQEELSARELEAWDLVEMQQYSAEEAGLAMCCSGSAVRGVLARARAKLVARLARGGTMPANDPEASHDATDATL